MLNSCERLSATVTAKKVTLILSAIVSRQGQPAGSAEQALGREGRRGELGSAPSSLGPGCLQGGCHTHALSRCIKAAAGGMVRARSSQRQTQQHSVFHHDTLMQSDKLELAFYRQHVPRVNSEQKSATRRLSVPLTCVKGIRM